MLQDPQPHVSISWTDGNRQQLLQEAVEQRQLSTPQQQYGLLVRWGSLGPHSCLLYMWAASGNHAPEHLGNSSCGGIDFATITPVLHSRVLLRKQLHKVRAGCCC